MRLSERTAFDPTPNALATALAAHPPRYDLTLANPTRAGFAYPDVTLSTPAYAPHPFGLPAAREAVAMLVGAPPERVVLTASTSEAYAWLLKVLCDPGDEVLCPRPSYPLFEHLAAFESVRLVPYSLAYDGAWHIDFDSVRPTARTRAIFVVSPNNPTGHYTPADDLARLAEHGLPLVVDEVFAPYRLIPGPAPRALDAPGRVCSLGGLSKQAGLPQLKASWIAFSPGFEALLPRLELVADTYLSLSTPVQHALPELLERRIEADILRRVQGNLGTLRGRTRDTPVELLRVEGGWYAVLALPATRDEEAWTLELLRRDGVAVQPGFFYDFEQGPRWVVSLLPEPGTFAAGIERLVARVRED